MRKKEMKEIIDNLKEQNDNYLDIIVKHNKEIFELKRKNEKLNLDFMTLLFKYKK